VALLLLGVLVALVVPLAPAQAFDDSDGDGLDDGLEDVLASRYFPWVWFDSGENYGCTEPATSWNPGTAVARVRPHPGDPAKIAISYAILYRRDCGDWYGGSHNGDVEPFSMTLAPNGGCPYGYGAYSLKTTGHTGTWFEHSDQRWLGNDCTWGRLAGGCGSEYLGGLAPCEMCWWQRYAHIAALVPAALAFTGPAGSQRSRYLTILAAIAIGVSGAIGIYHAGVELGIFEGFTTCTANSGGATSADIFRKIAGAPLIRCGWCRA